ncbi:biotin transporter BioY [Synechococcales cyanobacterium C]|uniref:Biotin transporter n=1 Tax=Petrachloros mirabilis ULC683 TaxID=2781853 RepID=A0A8K1ZWA1_9CYAN|nr:biotin transporter BioY [Petrachloros mirabilis]NCJ05033.1 biotin transporter BioY [Petrachloros mirabilis ULC683]
MKKLVLSPFDELLWAVIGLFLTISGVFIEPAIPLGSFAWPVQWEQVPTYGLGSSLQVAAVLLVGCLGGCNAAALSQVAYLALGLSGLQVFALGGGLGVWQSPAFGYLLGFIPGAWVCGHLAFRRRSRLEALFVSCLLGLGMIHLLGVLYLSGLWLLRDIPQSWWSLVLQFSVLALPGQLLLVCAVAFVAFLLRRLLFY